MDKNKSIDGLFPHQAKSNHNLNNNSESSSIPVKIKTTEKIQVRKKVIKVENPEASTKTDDKSIDIADKTSNLKNSDSNITTNEDFLKPVQAFNFSSNELEKKEEESSKDTSNLEIKPKKSKKEKKEKKEKKPVSKTRKIITSILLIIVFLLIGGVTWAVLWGNDIIAKITGGQGNVLDFIGFIEEKYEPLKTDSKGRTNILAFGTSGYDMDGSEGDGYHAGSQLTDSIMVISLNQENGDIAMLSLPRDLKASPTCTATGKINEVYWCNNMYKEDEAGGANALMEEVGSILGLDFQYYAHVNWESLIAIVDTLGGIEITLDEDINDYYYTGAVYEAGVTYTINGDEALGIARARHGTTGGDFSRGASQQKILIGIKDKILSKNLSLGDLLNLANILGDNLRTNFSLIEMKTLAHYFSVFDFNSMRQVSLIDPYRFMTTGMIDGISYVLPSAGVGIYDEIQEYVAKMFSSDPRVYEEYSILILNGTQVDGLASTEKDKLTAEGYSNITTGNAPEGEYPNEYTLYILNNSAPGVQRMLDMSYDFHIRDGSSLPEGVSRDYTFVILLGGHKEETQKTTTD